MQETKKEKSPSSNEGPITTLLELQQSIMQTRAYATRGTESRPRRSSFRRGRTGRSKREDDEGDRHVSFGDIVVLREHGITLGDHPWRDGPPIALSWEQIQSKRIDFEEFEKARTEVRRKEEDLRTSGMDRRQLLKERAGYSDSDLLKAERYRTHFSGRRLTKSRSKSLP